MAQSVVAFVKGKSCKFQDYDPNCVYMYNMFDYGVDVSVLTAWMLLKCFCDSICLPLRSLMFQLCVCTLHI